MYQFDNTRLRSGIQSISSARSVSHVAQGHLQDYYSPNEGEGSTGIGRSASLSRQFADEHARTNPYHLPNDIPYNSGERNISDSTGILSSSHAPQQTYDRHAGNTFPEHLFPSGSHQGQMTHDFVQSELPNLAFNKRNDVLRNFPLAHTHTDFASELNSSLIAPPSEHVGDSDYWSSSKREASPSEPQKPRKTRREKPRIELAPDQPPTTQGKPRARVYVACLQCRTRKIRCDGAKPICHNCGRRAAGGTDCNYDAVPKRRGPDRTPGARQRLARDPRNEVEGGAPRRRRRRPAAPIEAKQAVIEQNPAQTTSSIQGQGSAHMKTSPTSPIDIADIALITVPSQKLSRRHFLETPLAYSPHELSPSTSTITILEHPSPAAYQRTSFNSAYETNRQLPTPPPTSDSRPVRKPSKKSPTVFTNDNSYTAHDFVPIRKQSSTTSSRCRCHNLVDCPGVLSIDNDQVDFPRSASLMPTYRDAYDLARAAPSHGLKCGYLVEVDEDGRERQDTDDIISEPSLNFTRKVWWDSLLSLYLSPTSTRLHTLSVAQRESAAQSITSDLRFLFRASNYWFSFFHIPTFFGNFFDPARRERIQPSLVLALLAMATFWQSSEIGRGHEGRERALRFRDEAQAALDASFNSGWVDETLAQAAWLLALFEICAHPLHSTQRSTSSMVMLDSIIRSLSLTLVDADDPNATLFLPGTVPIVSVVQRPDVVWFPEPVSRSSSDTTTDSYSASDGDVKKGCSCRSLTLGKHWSSTDDHAPMWGSTPAWDPAWSEGDIRKESCRRLCWSSMIMAAGHISYTTAQRSEGLNLFISDPANYALLFSGESVARSPMLSGNSSKDTVWALYDRSYLLWHGCMRMRANSSVTDEDKAQFAVKAWLEADSLEQALNKHTCFIERAFIFQAREYIFNTRMCISYEFQRYVPLVTANMSGLFHRDKAAEWLEHQADVAERFMQGLHTITGNSNNFLARRPFFVFWFMGQIHRALTLWQCDKTLTVALNVCKSLIPAIDYLTALWPCPEQRNRYQKLRTALDRACFMAGVEPPPPMNISVPLDSLAALL